MTYAGDQWAVVTRSKDPFIFDNLVGTYDNLNKATQAFNEEELNPDNIKVMLYQLFTDSESGYHG